MSAAARRDKRRRDWPRGLYEPRPGYYVWREPAGRTLVIGRVPFAHARAEAIAANAHVAGVTPSLVARPSGTAHTVDDLLDQMPAAKAKNTAAQWRTLDKRISAGLGETLCQDLTVAKCAALIEGVESDGKARTAEALRSRLIAVCERGQQLGWLASNPAEPTRRPEVAVQRGRLTLETYRKIEAVAGHVADWLPHAMRLGVVTGADRSTIAGLQHSNVQGDSLVYRRGKTGVMIAVPLDLHLDALGLTLRDLVKHQTGTLSKYLVHHTRNYGNAPAGAPVFADRISKAFTEARILAGIPDDGAPTFHELRSLAKRLYERQGNVDTKALLGHATERMADLYANPRGAEVVRVRVGTAS